MDYWTGRLSKQWNMPKSMWMRVLFCPSHASKLLNNTTIQNETKWFRCPSNLWDGGQGCQRAWPMKAATEETLGIHAAGQEWCTWTLTLLNKQVDVSRWCTSVHGLPGEPPAQGSLSIEVGQGWFEWFGKFLREGETLLRRAWVTSMHSLRTMSTVISEEPCEYLGSNWVTYMPSDCDSPAFRLWLVACWWKNYK